MDKIPPGSDRGYSLENQHPLVLKHAPQFLTKGGEHIVYEIPNNPNIIVKAVTQSLAGILRENIANDVPPDSISEWQRDRASRYLKNESKRFSDLKKYFENHTLNQKKFLLKLPVNPDIVATLSPDKDVEAKELWGILVVQERSKGIENTQMLDLVAGYSERRPVMPGDYIAVTNHLIFNMNTPQLPLATFEAVQYSKSLSTLIARAKIDTEIQMAVKDCISRAIAYTNETSEILDLAGSGNLIFYPKEGKWTYELIDALYPIAGEILGDARSGFEKLLSHQDAEGFELSAMRNSVNYVRTINGLAEHFVLPERIRCFEGEMPPSLLEALRGT